MVVALEMHASVVQHASKGAVLDADKLAEDSRGLAGWFGAGQLHRVLLAEVTFLLSRGGATFSKTLASCAVFGAQPTCYCLRGAAVDRAGLPAVMIAEASAGGFVGATAHRA